MIGLTIYYTKTCMHARLIHAHTQTLNSQNHLIERWSGGEAIRRAMCTHTDRNTLTYTNTHKLRGRRLQNNRRGKMKLIWTHSNPPYTNTHTHTQTHTHTYIHHCSINQEASLNPTQNRMKAKLKLKRMKYLKSVRTSDATQTEIM